MITARSVIAVWVAAGALASAACAGPAADETAGVAPDSTENVPAKIAIFSEALTGNDHHDVFVGPKEPVTFQVALWNGRGDSLRLPVDFTLVSRRSDVRVTDRFTVTADSDRSTWVVASVATPGGVVADSIEFDVVCTAEGPRLTGVTDPTPLRVGQRFTPVFEFRVCGGALTARYAPYVWQSTYPSTPIVTVDPSSGTVVALAPGDAFVSVTGTFGYLGGIHYLIAP